MHLRFVIFISIITSVLSLACFYLGSRANSLLQLTERSRVWVWVGLVVFVLIQLAGPFSYRYWGHATRPHPFQWLTYILLGCFATLFFFTLFYDLGWKIYGFFGSLAGEAKFNAERRGFLALLLTGGVTTGIGLFQSFMGPKVYEVKVPLKDLPPELEGFRILQISDLHVGPLIGETYVKKVVEMSNALNPDVIALTGDMVDGKVSELGKDLASISELKPKYGTFFITGNHEYYSGALEWIEFFKAKGIQPLINEHRVVAGKLVIAGVPDISAQSMIPEHVYDPKKALEGAPEGAIRILLAHQPKAYQLAESLGYHLQLSGHTHGGQFFPWSLVVALAHRFSCGMGRWKSMWIYVNRGTGYWGPPNRFSVPSEITLFTLSQSA